MRKIGAAFHAIMGHGLRAGLMAMLVSGPLAAHEPAGAGDIDEERLVQRIKQEVLEALSEGALLDQAIDAGIERAAERKRQQAAQAEALKTRNLRPVSSARDHILGDPDAELSLVEYSDFECPFCKRFHGTPKALVAAYEGRLNWVYRHFPLASHNPAAQKEAEATECAAELGGNQAFWRYTDLTYERSQSNGKGFSLDKLVLLAREVGLDEATFRACMESGRHADRVRQDYDNGTRSGVSGTPASFLVNRKTGQVRPIPGAKSLAYIKAEIDRMLGEARQ